MISIVHNNSDKGEGGRSEILKIYNVQRLTLFCANIVKKDPGRAGQNSLATAGTNFTKPGAVYVQFLVYENFMYCVTLAVVIETRVSQ